MKLDLLQAVVISMVIFNSMENDNHKNWSIISFCTSKLRDCRLPAHAVILLISVNYVCGLNFAVKMCGGTKGLLWFLFKLM